MARAFVPHIITDDTALVAGPYQIERSLRFDRNGTPGLYSEGFGSDGNRRKWTLSLWLKPNMPITDGANRSLFGLTNTGNNREEIAFNSSNRIGYQLRIGGNHRYGCTSDAQMRDYTRWYHVVFQYDSDNSTANDRVRIHINGERQSVSFYENDGAGYNSYINSNGTGIYLGRTANSNSFDGYLAEVNFIDGLNVDPLELGFSEFQTGIWMPKKYTGNYGNQGWYLNFSDNSGNSATTIGKDFSGNGHNWAPSNFSITANPSSNSAKFDTDSKLDTPTNNWATLNPIRRNEQNSSTTATRNGLLYAYIPNDNQGSFPFTQSLNSGKWYWEIQADGGNSTRYFGIVPDYYTTDNAAYTKGVVGFTWFDSNLVLNANGMSPTSNAEGSPTENTLYASGFGWNTSTDIAQVALDMDTREVQFGKNGTFGPKIRLPADNCGYVGYVANGTNGATNNWKLNFGASGGTNQGFDYAPPTGFKPINSKNLLTAQASSVMQPKKFFGCVTYTGNNTTGRSISGLEFKPDFLWIKSRATGHHGIYDSIRGVQKRLIADETGAESDVPIGSFDQNGFSFASEMYYNANSVNYVAWCWKAGGAAVTNNDGTIATQVSVNKNAGFSIITYTGTGADEATIGHGLGRTPKFVMTKRRNNAINWVCKHECTTKVAYLDLADQFDDNGSGQGIIDNLNSSTYRLDRYNNQNNINGVNGNGDTYVSYCWAEIPGYSKIGRYRGKGGSGSSGEARGPFIYCGFEPAWVMIKEVGNSNNWIIQDNTRDPSNPTDGWIYPDLNAGEETGSGRFIDLLSDGFKVRSPGTGTNRDNGNFLYMAFAETSIPSQFNVTPTGRARNGSA